MKVMVVFACAAFAVLDASHPSPHSLRVLTVDECRQLALIALDPAARKLPKLGVDENKNPYFPTFYHFEITWDNPAGSVVVDHYAVDPRTGDVWSDIVCRMIKSQSLKKLQRTMRKQIGLRTGDYIKLKRPGPMCQ
jgi:hypothetical protein